jgi:Ribbon-helix-helix protein, copG family
MQRTQIQLPEPLLAQIKAIARARDWSVAELIRRGMESYVQTCADAVPGEVWVMPVLRGSGGQRVDPANVRLEAEVITSRFNG